MSELTEDQRAEIQALSDQGYGSADIAGRIGISTRAAGSVLAWLRHRDSWAKPADASAAIDEAIETTFGLERDMQLSLRANIQQLEQGLTITDGGKEQTVESGRIDITARDASGATVVIELKAGSADHHAIGQILSYIGDLLPAEGKTVRGILVAADFTARAVSAARAVPNLELRKYTIKFAFESVTS